MTKLNDFESGVITNETAIDIDQHSSKCREVFADLKTIIYESEQPAKGESYVAVFNIYDEPQRIEVDLTKLGLDHRKVRERYGPAKTWPASIARSTLSFRRTAPRSMF